MKPLHHIHKSKYQKIKYQHILKINKVSTTIQIKFQQIKSQHQIH